MEKKRVLPVYDVLEDGKLRYELTKLLRGVLAWSEYDRPYKELTLLEQEHVRQSAQIQVFSGKWTLS